PSKFTDERVERLLAAIRAGNTRQAACRYNGISDELLGRWQRRSAESVDALTRAEAESEVALVAYVRQAAQTDWRAGMELLSRRWPEPWGRHDRVDLERAAMHDSARFCELVPLLHRLLALLEDGRIEDLVRASDRRWRPGDKVNWDEDEPEDCKVTA